MKDRLLTIREMNKEPLQLHAKKLLRQAKEEPDETDLYLTQIVWKILLDQEILRDVQKWMLPKVFNQWKTDIEELPLKHPKLQMAWLMNSGLTDEENSEEIMNCETLDDLMYLITNNVIYNREAIEAEARSELDATIMGYND